MFQVTRKELFPGVWLRAIHTNKFKGFQMTVTLLAPLERENAGANALVPYVLRRGSAAHPDMESMSAALDQLYGGTVEPIVRKKGETQCISMMASFLDDTYALEGEAILEPAAKLLCELLLSPKVEQGAFDPDYVSSEKMNMANRIRSQINDKRSYAGCRLTQLMCEEEAYGVDRLGDLASVERITPSSLWERYQALLKDCAVEVYFCGSAQPERVENAFREALSGLPVNEERLVPDCDVRLTAVPEPRVVEEIMEVTQGKLAMGFRTGGITCWEEEYPALVMCNAVFGGTAMSKLFMNVREKMSLCYYASSSMEKLKGLIVASSGIEFDKYQQAKDEILHQLDKTRKGEIEDWELEGARRIMVGTYQAALDDPFRLEDFWLGQTVAGLEAGPDEVAASFETVTREQVARAAQKLTLDTIYFLKGKEG